MTPEQAAAKQKANLERARNSNPEAAIVKERTRIPFGGARLKLDAAPIPGYHSHWFNDDADNMVRAKQAGYEFVLNAEISGFKELEEVTPPNQDLGEKVKRLVGKNALGTPKYAYLMKIKQEWYDEDKAELAKRSDMIDESILRGDVQNVEGRYIPTSGIKMTRS